MKRAKNLAGFNIYICQENGVPVLQTAGIPFFDSASDTIMPQTYGMSRTAHASILNLKGRTQLFAALPRYVNGSCRMEKHQGNCGNSLLSRAGILSFRRTVLYRRGGCGRAYEGDSVVPSARPHQKTAVCFSRVFRSFVPQNAYRIKYGGKCDCKDR